MPHQFQPKDARIKSDIDFDDDELTLYSQSSRKTRTQELADFLLSTGPEEFHKNNSVPSSASSSGSSTSGSIATLSFLKRARNKSKSTLASNTKQHNNNNNKSHHGVSTSVTMDASTSPAKPSSDTTKPHKTHIEIAPPPPEPILPRRESSLYSGSMRYRSMSSNGLGTQRTHPTSPKNHQRHVADLFESRQIDQALQQRITTATANGHLPITTTTTTDPSSSSSSSCAQVRHAQIQTDQSLLKSLNRPPSSSYRLMVDHGTDTTMPTTVEELQRQIALEKQRQKRLEAAMNTTCDQFEVLSGIAYVKLRMIWEEKMHWESAYFALKEQCGEV
ncbi:hypothetical protein K492DRAFT_194279 [Lichtheimia hyalospora FSU 10163]|nr:hypothetical protein K492DRAFT_194279 [Lichtheimia hyalospora FSU 10163]